MVETHFYLPHSIVIGFGQSDVDRHGVFHVVYVVINCKIDRQTRKTLSKKFEIFEKNYQNNMTKNIA